jgi:hypothetical protein
MLKKEHLFLLTIFLMGSLDWLTTVVGILFRGGTEINPLLSGLTNYSMILFSAIKLSAVGITGIAFYKVANTGPINIGGHFNKMFLNGAYSLTFIVLTMAVANNMIAVCGL